MRKFEIEEVVRYELEVDDEDLEGVPADRLERVVDEIFCDQDTSKLPVTIEARHVTEIKPTPTCDYCGRPREWGHFCQEFIQAESRRVAEQRIREDDES